jgi:hypothetical protein
MLKFLSDIHHLSNSHGHWNFWSQMTRENKRVMKAAHISTGPMLSEYILYKYSFILRSIVH